MPGVIKNKLAVVTVLALWGAGTQAFAQAALTSDDLRDVLGRFAIVYPNGGYQSFSDNGDTLYFNGRRNTVGQWEIVGDDICSSFPPKSERSCYDARWNLRNGARIGIIFTEKGSGVDFVGEFREKR